MLQGMHGSKVLIAKGGKEPPIEVMNEIFVFCLEIDLDKAVGSARLYHELANFVVSRHDQAGNRGDKLHLKFPKPDGQSDGLGSVTTDNGKFVVHFKCCDSPLHIESYDSEIGRLSFSFRNNHDKFLCILVVQRSEATIFEGSVLQMFTQASLMRANDTIQMKMQTKRELAASDPATSDHGLSELSTLPSPRASPSVTSRTPSSVARSSTEDADGSERPSSLISPKKEILEVAATVDVQTPPMATSDPYADMVQELGVEGMMDEASRKRGRATSTPCKASGKKNITKVPKIIQTKVEIAPPVEVKKKAFESLFKPKKVD
jgi:hypothetical protein